MKVRCHFNCVDMCVGYTILDTGEQCWLPGSGRDVIASGVYRINPGYFPTGKTAQELWCYAAR